MIPQIIKEVIHQYFDFIPDIIKLREIAVGGVRETVVTSYRFEGDRQECSDAFYEGWIARFVYRPKPLEDVFELMHAAVVENIDRSLHCTLILRIGSRPTQPPITASFE